MKKKIFFSCLNFYFSELRWAITKYSFLTRQKTLKFNARRINKKRLNNLRQQEKVIFFTQNLSEQKKIFWKK